MAADKERGPGSASAEIGKYLEILAKDPGSRVFAPLAEAYRKAGLLDDAIETALEGLQLHPNYLGGRVALGRAYFEKKQYAEAAAEMKKVVASAPDNLMAHKVLGQVAVARNDLPAAEKAFAMVLLLDPRDQEAQQFVANIGGGAKPAVAPTPTPPAPRPAPPPTVAAPAPVPPLIDEIAIPEPPKPAARAPEAPPFEDIQPFADIDLDRGEPFAEIAPPAVSMPVPETAAPAAPLPGEPATGGDAIEIETFARVPWSPGEPSDSGEGAATASAPEAPALESEESPFEVFGRSKRGVPPPSRKGEGVPFREIELEDLGQAPVPEEPAPADEPVFEVFTRTSGARTPAPPPKTGRREHGGPREIDVETTALELPEHVEAEQPALDEGLEIERTAHPAGGAPPETEAELVLEDELPPIDLAREIAEDRVEVESEPTLPPADASVPGGEAAPAADAELEQEAHGEALPSPAPEAPPNPAFDEPPPEAGPFEPPESWSGGPAEMSLDDEIPNIDLTREVQEEAFEPEQPAPEQVEGAQLEPEQLEPEQLEEEQLEEEQLEEERFELERFEPERFGQGQREEEALEPAAGPARGVFDTETLAAIYVNQGFYGRAAEIYRRLLSQRPADQALRAKLDDVLARERGEAAAPPAAADAALPAPTPAAPGEDDTIRQLQILLEAFRGGPR